MRYILAVFLFLSGVALAAEQPTYIGINNCKICHMPHFESWASTRMAGAYALLMPGVRAEAKRKAGLNPNADYSSDSNCLRCHTTGYGAPGGFISMEKTPSMINVQCEMCHGPGSVYAEMMLAKAGTYSREDYIKQGGLTLPSAQNNVCTDKCHNKDSPFISSGYEFNFESRKEIGTHDHNLKYIDINFDL